MTTTIIGYPRIGEHRELKFATQKYFKHQISAQDLQEKAKALRKAHWETIQAAGIDQIPTGDFSFFDNTLDVANLLNIVPKRYQDLNLSPLDTYFAQARGYQGEAGDVKALAMKKWFNTNYHYLVPEFDHDTQIQVTDWQLFAQFEEAKALGINRRPTLIGPYTLLKLSRFIDVVPDDFVADLISAYTTIIDRLHQAGADWVQLDEPALVYDQTDADLALFERLYTPILAQKKATKILVQTYFGDLTDSFDRIQKLPFDGFGLDFVEGYANLDLLKQHGFPAHATLFAGIVNGKNIWRTHYADALATIKQLATITDKLVLSTSTSLLHVPYTLRNEAHLKPEEKQYLAFAEEKLNELHELDAIFHTGADHAAYQANVALFSKPRYQENKALNAKIAALTPEDYKRTPERKTRLAIQAKEFKLPLLPTTTIGSFPKQLKFGAIGPSSAATKLPKTNTPPSTTKKKSNGSDSKKKLAWMFSCTVNSNATTWWNILAKTLAGSALPIMVGFKAMAPGALNHRLSGAMSSAPNRLPLPKPSLPKVKPIISSRACSRPSHHLQLVLPA